MFCASVYAVMSGEMWLCPRDKRLKVHRIPRTLEPTREDNNRLMLEHPRLKKTACYFETHVELAKNLVLVGKCEGCPHCNLGDLVLVHASGASETTAQDYGPSPYTQARLRQQKYLDKLTERQQAAAGRLREEEI